MTPHESGAAAALAAYGLTKTAWSWGEIGSGIKNVMVGSPSQWWKDIRRPGGIRDIFKNQYSLAGFRQPGVMPKVMAAASLAGNYVLPAYMLYNLANSSPYNRGSNIGSFVGSTLGSTLMGPMGVIGANIGGALGAGVGQAAGTFFNKEPPPVPPETYAHWGHARPNSQPRALQLSGTPAGDVNEQPFQASVR